MDANHNQNITRFLDALNPVVAGTVIAPDRMDTLLTVKESLDAGFFVGTLGDRVSNNGKTARCEFLGRSAAFPVGPIVLAAMTHRPVILFFGLYRGGNRYEITSNILPMRSPWIAIVVLKRSSYGCSATRNGWSITRALRLITGLIFIRFGTRLRRVRSLHNRIGKSKHGLRITRTFSPQ